MEGLERICFQIIASIGEEGSPSPCGRTVDEC